MKFTLATTRPDNGVRYGDQRHAKLLSQDDDIPGNRKDGFRFHYLIFAIVATPLYLWLELSFGVRLLDSISGAADATQTRAIEHWGRLISGCAVSLLFLTQWFEQCEKWDRPWWIRLSIAFVICLVCVPVTWIAQSQLMDFHVKQGSTEIAWAIPFLVLTVALGLYAIRFWLQSYGQRRKSNPLITIAVMVLIAVAIWGSVLGFTVLLPHVITRFVPEATLAERLGQERQQAATLVLVRKALQSGTYTLLPSQSRDLARSIIGSPEGKAAMAMFPVLGSSMDQSRFVADRPRLLQEVMYLDWEEQYGAQSFDAFKDGRDELLAIYSGKYQAASQRNALMLKSKGVVEVKKVWQQESRALFGEIGVPPGLSLHDFEHDATVSKILGKRLACFDCRFHAAMDRPEFTYELFLGTRIGSYHNVLATLEDSKHFEKGHDGEVAARTYWVPIWALLFSMIGAFTHIFKLTFYAAEYANLRTFAKVHAADSSLSNDVVANTRRSLLAVMAAIVFFIFFMENRVTGSASYHALHGQMWVKNPVVGGIAAHWTVNAQGILYPFTKKICPDWLTFDDDPFDHLPLSLIAGWVSRDED